MTHPDGPYDPGDLTELAHKIMHSPAVVQRLTQAAQQAVDLCDSENFGVTVQNEQGTKRARAYAHPINDAGIHQEIEDRLLIKAAASMEGWGN